MVTLDQLNIFAELIQEQTACVMRKKFPTASQELIDRWSRVNLKKGKKYIYVDRDTSGYLMIDSVTGVIYGIKAYGQVNKRKTYGTIDTILHYNWG